MAISREAVIYGFRFFLGRDPESERVIDLHTGLRDEETLAKVLINSTEFGVKNRQEKLFSKHKKLLLRSGESANKPVRCRVLLFGNCQVNGLGRLLEVMHPGLVATHLEAVPSIMNGFKDGSLDLAETVASADLIYLHFDVGSPEYQLFLSRYPSAREKLRVVPRIVFGAFHPDNDYLFHPAEGLVSGVLGHYQSALVFYAWQKGMTQAATRELFCKDVFQHLGYLDGFDAAKRYLLTHAGQSGLPLDGCLDAWLQRGCFMHTVNHPKLHALADVAELLLLREGLSAIKEAAAYIEDGLAHHSCWPVYPEVGECLGITGSYRFKKPGLARTSVEMIGLEDLIEASFAVYSRYEAAELRCPKLDREGFRTLDKFLGEVRSGRRILSAGVPVNPYQGLADYQFWRRAIERTPAALVDPVVRARFSLTKEERVATAGSCFAQHISRTLTRNGFNYFVVEDGAGLEPAVAASRNFGVFSARYGNVYTARQLYQMITRAYGRFAPEDSAWQRPDGRYVDPFRPQIEPEGFATPDAVAAARQEHQAQVRAMLEKLDILVFTLGLTESWRRKSDGAVFPLAPGVVAGSMDTAIYEYVNFTAEEVAADTQKFLDCLSVINPKAKVILTVSPVPLIATYEDRHVLVSTTYSKAALRAAAENIVRRNPQVDYFPSFEIITGNFSRGAYYEDDFRAVRQSGVDHVMRLFLQHYSGAGAGAGAIAASRISRDDSQFLREAALIGQVICDEEALDG